jgi:hypothetical protein
MNLAATDILEIRHRATVVGTVGDELTGKPMEGAELLLTGGRRPAALAHSGPGGLFSFIDVPEGEYRVRASWPGSLGRYAEDLRPVTVPAAKPLGLLLRPTSVRGKVVDSGGLGISLAFIRLRDSLDSCYTDRQGDYVLAGVEPGSRRLLVSARGYVSASVGVELSGAGVQKDVDNISLERI